MNIRRISVEFEFPSNLSFIGYEVISTIDQLVIRDIETGLITKDNRYLTMNTQILHVSFPGP